MTGIQELHDDVLGLRAQLEGKLMELAMAKGEKDTARIHMNEMNRLTIERRGFRIQCAEDAGGCFFDAAGAADAGAAK